MRTVDEGRGPITASARGVLRWLAQNGAATRPEVGAALGVSRPTMSAAIGELERLGYAEEVGLVQGALGRRAVRYRTGPAAGHVIAVDAGSTHVRLRVAALDGRLLHSRVHRLASSKFAMDQEISGAVAEEVEGAVAEGRPEWGPLRTIGIALPVRVVGPGGDAAATGQDLLFSRFALPEGIDLVLENNVNCAAVAEQRHGAARERATFSYIQIGLKVGMGFILDGRLVRGANGAAGEIGHLSFPFGPGLRPEPGAAERYLGTEALIERVRADWPAGSPPPEDTSALFARAEAGEAAALAHVERHAEDVGALVSACVSVVDPGFVVLGGGLGSSRLLLPRVRETVARLSYPVEVETSLLGPDATVLGIEKLAIERALALILDGVSGA